MTPHHLLVQFWTKFTNRLLVHAVSGDIKIKSKMPNTSLLISYLHNSVHCFFSTFSPWPMTTDPSKQIKNYTKGRTKLRGWVCSLVFLVLQHLYYTYHISHLSLPKKPDSKEISVPFLKYQIIYCSLPNLHL